MAISDVYRWDRLAEECLELLDVPELLRESAVMAIGHLRSELGNDFVQRAVNTGHPIAANVHNQAPWTRLWFASLGGSIALLKDSPGFEILKSKILDPTRYYEAISILGVAKRLVRASFKVALESPAPGGKKPDITCINQKTGETVYVEVSKMEPGNDRDEAYRQYDQILRVLLAAYPEIEHAGFLHKRVSVVHLTELLGEIQELVQRAQREHRFLALSADGAYEFGLAPRVNREELAAWAGERGLRLGFRGYPESVDERRRLKRKIHEEQKQCPTDSPGVLVLYDDHLWIDGDEWRSLADDLEETVYSHPQLATVAIVLGKGTVDSPDDVRDSPGSCHWKTTHLGVGESSWSIDSERCL